MEREVGRLGVLEGGKTVIRIYYMRKKSISSKSIKQAKVPEIVRDKY